MRMNATSDLEMIFTASDIERAIDRTSVRLNLDLQGTNPVFVCVLKGGLPFTWDLMKRTQLDIELDYVRVRRYEGTKGGELFFEGNSTQDFSGRTIVLIDDVLDRGVTLKELTRVLSGNAARVLSAVLIDKVDCRDVEFKADYVALETSDEFLVGRGMDYYGRYRQLPDIYAWRGD